MKYRALLGLQLAATCAILAWMPGNIPKAAALLATWTVTFYPLSGLEMALFAAANVLFAGMDIASLRQGIFSFDRPDVWGLPFYEYFMWGFYLLHTRRAVGGPAPAAPGVHAWLLAGLFSLCFSMISDPHLLFLASGTVLLVAVAAFHDKYDIAYVLYMIALGTAIELTGVWSGQWHYPAPDLAGVPLWFATMWGGIGLFLRRLVLPLVTAEPALGRQT